MSMCRTCKYALYDGMCLKQGKFTLLDAPACDDYKPCIDVEVSKLKAENAKLRELVRELLPCYQWSDCYDGCMAADGPLCPHPAKLTERARELGVEVDA